MAGRIAYFLSANKHGRTASVWSASSWFFVTRIVTGIAKDRKGEEIAGSP